MGDEIFKINDDDDDAGLGRRLPRNPPISTGASKAISKPTGPSSRPGVAKPTGVSGSSGIRSGVGPASSKPSGPGRGFEARGVPQRSDPPKASNVAPKRSVPNDPLRSDAAARRATGAQSKPSGGAIGVAGRSIA